MSQQSDRPSSARAGGDGYAVPSFPGGRATAARAAWAPDRYAEWMRWALAEARMAGDGGGSASNSEGLDGGGVASDGSGTAQGDVPIGAVVVGPECEVIGRGHNVREEAHDPTGHAEVVALREAGAALGTWRLAGCTLVVTLEPCAMCAGAAVLSRVDRIVFGAWDDKAGACGSVWDLPRDRRALHRPEVVGGVLEEECGQVLLDFFHERRGRRPEAGSGG